MFLDHLVPAEGPAAGFGALTELIQSVTLLPEAAGQPDVV